VAMGHASSAIFYFVCKQVMEGGQEFRKDFRNRGICAHTKACVTPIGKLNTVSSRQICEARGFWG
jgi:hypothetical protein